MSLDQGFSSLSYFLLVQDLDLGGLDNRYTVNLRENVTTEWLGIQSLSLSGCILPERLDWEALGATRTLRRIDLSNTRVTEEGKYIK